MPETKISVPPDFYTKTLSNITNLREEYEHNNTLHRFLGDAEAAIANLIVLEAESTKRSESYFKKITAARGAILARFGESLDQAANRVVKERDEARAAANRVVKERDEARAALPECRKTIALLEHRVEKLTTERDELDALRPKPITEADSFSVGDLVNRPGDRLNPFPVEKVGPGLEDVVYIHVNGGGWLPSSLRHKPVEVGDTVRGPNFDRGLVLSIAPHDNRAIVAPPSGCVWSCSLKSLVPIASVMGDILPATDIEIAIAVQAEIARTDERLDALRKTARAAFERALKAGR